MAQELYESDHTPHSHRAARAGNAWLPWVLGGAGLALVAVLAAAAYFFVFTTAFTLDGQSVRLSAGSTVSTLFSRGLVRRTPGNLVAAKDHRVLAPGGGGQPYVTGPTGPLGPNDRIAGGSSLESHNGSDTVEATRIVREVVSAPTRYQGDGPVETVLDPGAKGVREITRGTVSNQVVSSREVKAPTARIVRRSALTSGAKVVALTFDDGPWPGQTLQILKILKANGIRATFFEIGRQARQSPLLSRQVADAGMEMGNHSESHPLNLGRLAPAAVERQIVEGQKDIAKASGQAPKSFRPPGGNTTPAMFPVLKKMNLPWVQWDIDTDDWRKPSVQSIVGRVMHNVRPGSVVLMHDGGGDRSHTIQALPQIIKGLKAQGYSFVTISELGSLPHVMG